MTKNIPSKRAIIISGLPGSGKTTLANALAQEMNGHHVIFPRLLGSGKRRGIISAIRNVIVQGRKKAVMYGLENAYRDFLATGKTTLILDGVLHPHDLEALAAIDPKMKIDSLYIKKLNRQTRALRVQFRNTQKGGGSLARATIWLRFMDVLHYRVFALADIKGVRRKSMVVSNSGTPRELVEQAKRALK